MAFNFQNYVRLWPFLQFVGLELVAGGLIYDRWHPTLGSFISTLAWVLSAGAFSYVAYRDGLKSLLNIRRILQALGYAAIATGLVLGLTQAEKGGIVSFVGTGVSMAGFAYDLIYP